MGSYLKDPFHQLYNTAMCYHILDIVPLQWCTAKSACCACCEIRMCWVLANKHLGWSIQACPSQNYGYILECH